MTATNFIFTKFFYGKGEDQEEAWANASRREDTDYDNVDEDEYQNHKERYANERRVT